MPACKVLPLELHDRIVVAAFTALGFTPDEAADTARLCGMASWHGNRSHNAIKALHLDHLFGTGVADAPGCVPGVEIRKLPSRFEAVERWDAQRKLGPPTAFAAMDRAIELADRFGVGVVAVDHAFHYLWGGGYVLDAAQRGYVAYTNCTAAIAEVVPFGGKAPTLGTNPHSWGLPTTRAIGFPIVIDWATSVIAMGKVQAMARERQPLPPGAAVDNHGQPTTDPAEVAALLPFGAHKGYGLALIDELVAALIGGSLPTLRSRPRQAPAGEKTTPCFFFQVIHPEAIDAGAFALGRDQDANVRAVIHDILGHGNDGCLLPGQLEHQAAQRSQAAEGLLLTDVEVTAFHELAQTHGVEMDPAGLSDFDD